MSWSSTANNPRKDLKHSSRASEHLLRYRDVFKQKKVDLVNECTFQKFSKVETEWVKYKTTKNRPENFFFPVQNKLKTFEKQSSSDELIKLAASTVKLLEKKTDPNVKNSVHVKKLILPNSPRKSIKKNK